MITELTPNEEQEVVGTVAWFRYQALRIRVIAGVSDNEAAALLMNVCHEYIKERGYGKLAENRKG